MSALDAEQIRKSLAQRFPVCAVHVFDSLPSTNAWLLERCADLAGPCICAAELQTEGRGRRGKSWQSPRDGVTFSIARRFQLPPAQLAGLSLATGCAVAEVLERYCAEDVGLKWPNDVLHDGKKLCGLLIELNTSANITDTVTGIGLNYSGVGDAEKIDQPFTDLTRVLAHRLPERNTLIADLAAAVLSAYQCYEDLGLSGFTSQWQKYDAFVGQPVTLSQANGEQIAGIARGVADSGALLIETDAGLQAFYAGEVSVRLRQ